MVGSNELRSRLGDDLGEALRTRHDEILAVAVAAHHDTVLRRTGDGIKASLPLPPTQSLPPWPCSVPSPSTDSTPAPLLCSKYTSASEPAGC